jgi:hypothetical protein
VHAISKAIKATKNTANDPVNPPHKPASTRAPNKLLPRHESWTAKSAVFFDQGGEVV